MRSSYLNRIIILPLCLYCLISIRLVAQEGIYHRFTEERLNDTLLLQLLPEYYYLFDSEAPFAITIKSNFKQLRRNKYEDNYQEAFLIYALNDSLEVRQEGVIKPRGNIRRKLCTNPPLKVKFEATDLYEGQLKDLSKLKMVVECRTGNLYRNLLLKEYLIYRMYNLVNENSFRVRLLEVKYIDTGRKNKCKEGLAFFIEKPKDMARRLGGVLIKGKNVKQRFADEQQETQLAIFQYMIGNTDYHVATNHNVKVLKLFDINYPDPFLIPYDFDYCGMVNAPYAIPHDRLGIENIRERLYRGYCRDDDLLNEQIQLFQEKKDSFYQLIETFPYLDKVHKVDMIRYLNSFYNELERPDKLRNRIKATCLEFY